MVATSPTAGPLPPARYRRPATAGPLPPARYGIFAMPCAGGGRLFYVASWRSDAFGGQWFTVATEATRTAQYLNRRELAPHLPAAAAQLQAMQESPQP